MPLPVSTPYWLASGIGTYVSLPDGLHALHNEIQDLSVMLNHVNAVIKDCEEYGLEAGIPQLLSHGQDSLLVLEEFLCRVRAGLKEEARVAYQESPVAKLSFPQGSLLLLRADIIISNK